MASKPKLDVLNEALMSIQERIEKCTAEVQRLKKAEESFAKGMFGLPSSTPSNKQVQDGDPTRQHAPSKTVFKLLGLKKAEAVKKAETYIDEKHPSDREKRYVTKGKPENNLPGDYKAKVSPASQGSDPKVEKVVKDEMGSMKPKMPKAAGTSGMPKAPEAPKAPKAPGAMAKMDLMSTAGRVGPKPTSPGGAMQMSEPKGVFAKLAKKKVN